MRTVGGKYAFLTFLHFYSCEKNLHFSIIKFRSVRTFGETYGFCMCWLVRLARVVLYYHV